MWYWKRMEKIFWTDHARKKEVLHRVKEQRNILHESPRQLATLDESKSVSTHNTDIARIVSKAPTTP
jgi:hypothetical protein